MPQDATVDPAIPPIHAIRGQRVMLDADLAALYGVPTKRLNEAVRRNAERFPADFSFRLTAEEFAAIRSQIATLKPQVAGEEEVVPNWSQFATSSRKHRGAAYRPWAFTEHGALMAGNVLNSPQAIQMSLYVVRAFVRLREEALASAVIFKRLATIDRKLLEHDIVLREVLEKLLPLITKPEEPPPKSRIGFDAG